MSAISINKTGISLARGARGFLVARIQQKLCVAADGVFGADTENALRRRSPQGELWDGQADQTLHETLGVLWPSDFERCINLVSVIEGTGFGDCNHRDIDGAGVTMGIAGFTTAHGEVQSILAQLASQAPAEIDRAGPSIAEELRGLLRGGNRRSAWEAAIYGTDGLVRREWLAAFRAWGQADVMQRLQLDHVRRFMWEPAVRQAENHGFHSMQARCLFLDIAVQNGGWQARHQRRVDSDISWAGGSESERMLVAARAVTQSAHPRWRADVLTRKQTIALGQGVVHGIRIHLENYGIPTFCVECGNSFPPSDPANLPNNLTPEPPSNYHSPPLFP